MPFEIQQNAEPMHPFSGPGYPHLGRRGLLEPIPAVKGQRAGYTLDRSPAYRRANTQNQKTIATHNHTYGQFRLTNSPKKHVFGLWEETKVPRENRHCNLQMHWQRMQTHRVRKTKPNKQQNDAVWEETLLASEIEKWKEINHTVTIAKCKAFWIIERPILWHWLPGAA